MTGCWHKGCDNCKNGCYLKRNFFGDDIYKCAVTGKKVNTFRMGDCGNWKCACERDSDCRGCQYK